MFALLQVLYPPTDMLSKFKMPSWQEREGEDREGERRRAKGEEREEERRKRETERETID